MTCPHCGADAPDTQKFCPSCARLIDSPLLRIKQELDAARGQPLHARLAAGSAPPPTLPASSSDRSPAFAEPPTYRIENAGPSVTRPFPQASPSASAPTPTELLGRAERASSKRQKPRQSSSTSTTDATGHSTTHGFDRSLHGTPRQKTAQATQQQQQKTEAQAGPPPERFTRPAAIIVLGLLDVFAAMALFAVAVQLTTANPEPRTTLVDMMRYLWGGLALFFLLTGLLVWGLRPLGRRLQMLVALLCLAAPPIGSIYGIVLLAYLGQTGAKALFSGKSPRQVTAAQWKAAQTVQKLSPVMAVLFCLFALFPALGIARLLVTLVPQAALMIDQARAGQNPLSALSAVPTVPAAPVEEAPASSLDPQTAAVEDVRALMRAQAAYASLNGGLYDRVECVVTPANCIPNRDLRNEVKLLEPRFTRMERNGYVFQLRLSAPPETRAVTVSKSGMTEYAYRAAPIKGEGPGFCGNQTGLLCTFDAKNVSGDPFKCPDACTPIQP